MKNLSILTKINLKNTFGSDVKGVSSGVLTMLKVLLFTAFSAYLNYVFADMGKRQGAAPIQTTVIMCGMATMLTLVYGIASAKSMFASGDYDMLSAMPVTKGEMVASKIICLYIGELMYSATILIPNAVVTSIYANSAAYVPGILFAAFLIPALPIALGCIIGLLLTLLTSKSRAGNIIVMLLYLLLFGGFIALAIFVNVNNQFGGQTNMLDSLGFMAYFNPTALLLKAAYVNSPLYYLAFVAANLAILAVAVALIAALFDKAHAAIARGNTATAKAKRYKVKGQASALMGHELRRLASSQSYWLQVILGPLFCIMMAIMLAVILKFAFDFDPDLYKTIAMVGTSVALLFSLSLTPPSIMSISIEGKNFYMIKSMPVRYKTYAWVKILFNSLIDIVGVIIACTITVIAVQPGIVEGVCLYVIPIAFSFGVNAVGLNRNMSRYRLNWTEEKEAFKDSAASFLAMLINGAAMCVCGAAVILLAIFVKPYLVALGVTAGIAFVYALVTILITLNVAEKKIIKIEV